MDKGTFVAKYQELVEPCLTNIIGNKYTVVPHYAGTLFAHSKIRLMVVGRAVNGWKEDFSGCITAQDVAECVYKMHSTFNFGRVVDSGAGSKDWYLFSRSAFWRLIRNVLERYGEASNGVWYNDSLKWQEKVLWSNLYKIAPCNGGNPDESLQKLQYKKCVDLLQLEIANYKPTHILFVTGGDWFFYDKWDNYFAESLDIKKNAGLGKYIVGFGMYQGAKVVVCKRPEMQDESALCEEVFNAFEVIEGSCLTLEGQKMKRYWQHRISHEKEVSYALLAKGYLTIGWVEFLGTDLMNNLNDREDFNACYDKYYGTKKRIRPNLWAFLNINVKDIVLVPLDDDMFAVCEAEHKPVFVSDLAGTTFVNEFKTECEITDKGIRNVDNDRIYDLGFVCKVKVLAKMKRSELPAVLRKKMHVQNTTISLNDVAEAVGTLL